MEPHSPFVAFQHLSISEREREFGGIMNLRERIWWDHELDKNEKLSQTRERSARNAVASRSLRYSSRPPTAGPLAVYAHMLRRASLVPRAYPEFPLAQIPAQSFRHEDRCVPCSPAAIQRQSRHYCFLPPLPDALQTTLSLRVPYLLQLQ